MTPYVNRRIAPVTPRPAKSPARTTAKAVNVNPKLTARILFRRALPQSPVPMVWSAFLKPVHAILLFVPVMPQQGPSRVPKTAAAGCANPNHSAKTSFRHVRRPNPVPMVSNALWTPHNAIRLTAPVMRPPGRSFAPTIVGAAYVNPSRSARTLCRHAQHPNRALTEWNVFLKQAPAIRRSVHAIPTPARRCAPTIVEAGCVNKRRFVRISFPRVPCPNRVQTEWNVYLTTRYVNHLIAHVTRQTEK